MELTIKGGTQLGSGDHGLCKLRLEENNDIAGVEDCGVCESVNPHRTPCPVPGPSPATPSPTPCPVKPTPPQPTTPCPVKPTTPQPTTPAPSPKPTTPQPTTPAPSPKPTTPAPSPKPTTAAPTYGSYAPTADCSDNFNSEGPNCTHALVEYINGTDCREISPDYALACPRACGACQGCFSRPQDDPDWVTQINSVFNLNCTVVEEIFDTGVLGLSTCTDVATYYNLSSLQAQQLNLYCPEVCGLCNNTLSPTAAPTTAPTITPRPTQAPTACEDQPGVVFYLGQVFQPRAVYCTEAPPGEVPVPTTVQALIDLLDPEEGCQIVAETYGISLEVIESSCRKLCEVCTPTTLAPTKMPTRGEERRAVTVLETRKQ